jgi:1,4-dihydroxy-2-naphthoate octaprenyltransferase
MRSSPVPPSAAAPPAITRRRAWLLAARPKTLPAAIAPVVVGAAAALGDAAFAPLPSLAALAGALLLQVGVNLANDYFDFHRGIDSPDRKGPLRVTQAGLIAPEQVRRSMIATFAAAALVGLYLVVRGGVPILAVGIASILSALAYSGGPWPLASQGVADLFVFVFFGPVAVCGTYFVQAGTVSGAAAAASIAPGLLITAILVVNNLRDIATDSRAGKRTLAVRLGVRGSLAEYLLLLAGAHGVPIVLFLSGMRGPLILLPLLSLPLAIPLVKTLAARHDDGPAMNAALAGTARLALAHSLIFAVGLAS